MLLSRLVLLFTVIMGYLVLYEWTSLSVSLSGSGGLRISFFVHYCSACLRKRLGKLCEAFERERERRRSRSRSSICISHVFLEKEINMGFLD